MKNPVTCDNAKERAENLKHCFMGSWSLSGIGDFAGGSHYDAFTTKSIMQCSCERKTCLKGISMQKMCKSEYGIG